MKKKKILGQLVSGVIYLLIGAFCGFLSMRYLSDMAENADFGLYMFYLCAVLLELYIAIFLQLIIHESGHLIFGLLTGYKFSSFRIGSFVFMKEEGKTRVYRLSLAGTGGQCLMCPPDMEDGKIPYVLYNLGGVIMNLIAAAFSALLYAVGFLPGFFLIMAVVGLGLALANGVPLRLGAVDNDGYNAMSLGKNPAALRSFWVQLKASDSTAKGVRIKDMPEEWFYLPDDEALKNSMVAVMAVFYENRLMDEHRFSEAAELIDHLQGTETGIVGLHMGLMTCDRIYCELAGDRNTAVIEKLLTKGQRAIMKQMKNYPTVLRTQYALALLKDNDEARAAEYKKKFSACAESYPYKGDITAEQELVDIASDLI